MFREPQRNGAGWTADAWRAADPLGRGHEGRAVWVRMWLGSCAGFRTDWRWSTRGASLVAVSGYQPSRGTEHSQQVLGSCPSYLQSER